MATVALLSLYSGVVERGVETFAYEISKRIAKKHKIILFQGGRSIQNPQIRTYQFNVNAKSPKSSNGILSKVYLDLQSLKILFFSIKIIPKLLNNKIDVIVPLNGGWQTVIIKIISIFTKSKILISGHAGIGGDDAWNLYFHPDIFVALTAAEKKWVTKLTDEVKVEAIANGVDLSRFHPKVKPKKINLSKPIVICASALVPYKRIDQTIKAVAKAKNLSLLLLGDGELRGQLDTLGKRLLGQRYLRLSVPHQEMPRYYKSGSVFTLVSKTEAFGISYIEAMACNLPVVATNDESRAEIIGDAGILTNPNDMSVYARDLKLAATTNYRSIPYNQALNFSWNKIAIKYAYLVDKLSNEK